MLVVFEKLPYRDAKEFCVQVEEWFVGNPKRKVCRTDLFKVRKGHVQEDVMKHALLPNQVDNNDN